MTTILKRSFFSVAANSIKIAITFITGILIIRSLGPHDYGVLSFLMASFMNLRMLLDMGTSSAFFTFISKFNRPKLFFIYYWAWIGLQLLVSLLFLWLIAPDSWIEVIWQGEDRSLILLAFIAIFSQQTIWIAVSQVAESRRLTITLQKINVSIAVIHLVIIFLLISIESITIHLILTFIGIEFFIASLYMWSYFKTPNQDESFSFRKMFQEYKRYCLPLLPFVWVSMINLFANRWLLQNFSGASEQGYYGAAIQLSSIAFLLSAPLLNILWKEISEVHHGGNQKKLELIYSRACRSIFFISAIISGFLIPWSSEVTLFLFGSEYLIAVNSINFMLIYSLWQSVGAFNINVLYALELTATRTALGIFFAVFSLPLAYVVLAPPNLSIPGFGLGAEGLSLKMAFIGVLTSNVYSWWISRKMKWKFEWISQLIIICSCFSVGFLTYFVANIILNDALSYLAFLSSAVVYLVLMGIISLRMPFLVSFNSNEIQAFQQNIAAVLNLNNQKP